ncbi:SRPBCC family protein [Streptomyces sp. NPDC048566]|uniref:SRPBCC family protein n=1 Tax=Streptomyces sp. NPDC048566 TaxID=3365569 RepID=UPI00371F1E6C
MSGERVHRLRHAVVVAAPARVVYALLADATRRPLYSPAVVHVERMNEDDGGRERLRVWERADGRVHSSLWARVRHPGALRVEFRRLRGEAPVTSLAGRWSVTDTGDGRCVVALHTEFTVAGDRARDVAATAESAEVDFGAVMGCVRRMAEDRAGPEHLVLTFRESVRVDGPGEIVYDFLYRAGDWAGVVPHVLRSGLDEPSPGIQLVDHAVAGADGTPRAVGCLRLCFPHAGRIVYKTGTPRAPVAAHLGEWSVLPDERGVLVVADHTVLLDPCALPARRAGSGDAGVPARPAGAGFADAGGSGAPARAGRGSGTAPATVSGGLGAAGAGPGPADVRALVREAIGRESLATLDRARRHAESAVHVLPLGRRGGRASGSPAVPSG